jgi:hypothetical protein
MHTEASRNPFSAHCERATKTQDQTDSTEPAGYGHGEVVEQAAEAADGVVFGVGFGLGFGGGCLGSCRGGDGVVALRWLVVGVGEWCPGSA